MRYNAFKDHVKQFVGNHWKELALIAVSTQVGMLIGLNKSSISDSQITVNMGTSYENKK